MSSTNVPILLTPGIIARQLDEPLHRVLYVLATRPHIAPSARAGRLRLYSKENVVQISDALKAIDARFGQGGAS